MWYPALKSAKPLPFPCAISNPYWERDQFEFTDGELPLSTVVPTGKPQTKPGTGRGHVCGTEEDFREGGHYDPLAPPVTYGMQGLPTCCGAPVLPPGGVIDGGKVGVAFPLSPGLDCPSATLLPDADQGAGHVESGLDNWWRVAVAVGETYRIEFPSLPHVVGLIVLEGADCGSATTVVNTAVDSSSPPTDVAASGSDFLFVRVFIVPADTTPMDYTIRVTQL